MQQLASPNLSSLDVQYTVHSRATMGSSETGPGTILRECVVCSQLIKL